MWHFKLKYLFCNFVCLLIKCVQKNKVCLKRLIIAVSDWFVLLFSILWNLSNLRFVSRSDQRFCHVFCAIPNLFFERFEQMFSCFDLNLPEFVLKLLSFVSKFRYDFQIFQIFPTFCLRLFSDLIFWNKFKIFRIWVLFACPFLK